MAKKKDRWEAITKTLRSAIPAAEYQTWFSRVNPLELDPQQTLLEVPNKFVAAWLQDKYLPNLQQAFQENLSSVPEIRFTYGARRNPRTVSTRTIPRSGSAPKPTGLASDLTFPRFVVAKSNRFAFSCAQAVAAGKIDGYHPLYIYGESSSGKTHLLHAIGNQILSKNPSASVQYLSHRELSARFSGAARSRDPMEFRRPFHHLDCLLIDDIHRLDGQEGLQAQLVSLLDAAQETPQQQIVVAASVPPAKVKKVLPPLKSRLEGGLLVEVKPPEQSTKIRIIAESAKEHGLTIPDDVAFFLASSANDLKSLQHHLAALETYASLNKGTVELSTVKWIVRNKSKEGITIRDIQRLSAEYFNITLIKLLSNKKDRVFSYPRQLAMYLSRQLTNASYKEIGKEFGNKDHSTVIYAVKRIESERRTRAEVREDIMRIQKLLV